MKTASYKETLHARLADPEYAAGYLNECLEEGEDVFLLALRDVVEANGGVGYLSKETKLNRESLHRLLSKEGNPRLSSLSAILEGVGLQIHFAPKAVAA